MSAVHINLIIGNHQDSGKDDEPEVMDLEHPLPQNNATADASILDEELLSTDTDELKGIPENFVKNFVREKRLTRAI